MLDKMIFIRNNKLFSCLYLLAVVIIICVVSLGFLEAVSLIAINPERLRNVTLPIWEQFAFSQHGLLVFYLMENYANKIALSNHATTFLFYLFTLYKVEIYVPALPMRVTEAFPNIISLAGVTFFFLSRLVEKRLAFGRGLLIQLFSISFHLQQAVQAKCQGCCHPGAWGESIKHP